MEEEQKKPSIYHKIEAGKKIRVFKSMYADKVYYKTQITQKNYDDTEDKFYIGLVFKKGVELDDPSGKGVDIIINHAVENFRKNPKDQYNPIVYLMITDFTLQETKEQEQKQAFDNFRSNLEENENENNNEENLPFY